MYDKSRLLLCAESLVGFRQDNNPIYSGLSAGLKASTSGYYVNDLSSVNFEVIAACLSNDAIDADTYLSNVYEASLFDIVDKFLNRTKTRYNSKELLANQSIVAGVASFKNKITQNARFVGYIFDVKKSNNLAVQISKLGFQSTIVQANLKIYLYETSQIEPIDTFTFNVSSANSLIWQDIADTILNYQSENLGTGQQYLLGYYEQDPNNVVATQLQGQALYMQFDCRCPGSAKDIWNKYVNIYPVEIPNTVLNWNGSDYDIPIVDNYSDYITTNTYGLTAKINVKCDITDVLCSNINMFAAAIQHNIALRILYDAYASTRINSISDSKREQSKQFAMKYDGILNGYNDSNGNKILGLIDTLTVDFSDLDNVCLPCKEIGISRAYLTR